MRRFTAWLANPWARARFLWVVGIGYIAWTILPVVIAVLFSFNSSRSLTSWQGFSTQWYVGNVNSVWDDPVLRTALFQSLKLASITVVIEVPLGVGFALALDRWRGRGSGSANLLMLFRHGAGQRRVRSRHTDHLDLVGGDPLPDRCYCPTVARSLEAPVLPRVAAILRLHCA